MLGSMGFTQDVLCDGFEPELGLLPSPCSSCVESTSTMDGVAGVTQCGLLPFHNMTYRFVVDDEPGTYWYHGHAGLLLWRPQFKAGQARRLR